MSRAALVFAVVLFAGTAVASPVKHVRLSWADAETAGRVTIAWNTGYDDASQVRYGFDTTYGLVAEGTSSLAPNGLGWVHEVSLAGLMADREYHYRVGGPNGWSEDFTFRTAPNRDGCAPYSFVVVGDNRSDDDAGPSPRWAPILAEALGSAPGFVLNTGDLVKDGGDARQWENFLAATTPLVTGTPFLATLGNHDDGPGEGDTAHYNSLFAFPRNDITNTEDFYYLLYENAIIVSLSTQTFGGGDIPFQTQAEWLDRVLTEHPKPWKFVFFHHPPYTGTVNLFGFDVNHPPDELGQNSALVPVFDEHHVDMVFNGHNHFYERFLPMKGSGDPTEGLPVSSYRDGTVYVVTGGGGALTYDIEFYMSLLCQWTPGSEICSGRNHYVLIEIDGNRLTYTAVSTSEQFLGSDPDNIRVLDALEIVKDDYVPVCAPPPVDEGPRSDVVVGVDAPHPADVPAPPLPDVHVVDTAAPRPDVAAPKPEVTPTAPDAPASEDAPGTTPDSEASIDATVTPEPPTGDGGGEGGCAAGGRPSSFAGALLALGIALAALRLRRVRGTAVLARAGGRPRSAGAR